MTGKEDIIFFLGAGASVEAGVPTTKKFVEEFSDYLKGDEKLLDLFKTIRKNLKKDIDVEYLLETVESLTDYIKKSDNFLISIFFEDRKLIFDKKEKENIKIFAKKLKAFIRKKTVVIDDEKISYMDPLVEIIRRPLIIFSVNYDTCIETLSLRHKLRYTDGFGMEWEPERFEYKKSDKYKFDIYLYKIHGSIMWYETNKQNYVKIPVLFNQEETDEIKLMTAETASPFILYPSPSKWKYNKILDFLRSELRNKLKDADICVIVGYSFRDDDILEIFLDAAQENENLKIVLISPSAGETYYSKLEKYPNQTKSPLWDKVITLNYEFGKVLLDNTLKHKLDSVAHLNDNYNEIKAYREDLEFLPHILNYVNSCIFKIDDVISARKALSDFVGTSLYEFPERIESVKHQSDSQDYDNDRKKMISAIFCASVLEIFNTNYEGAIENLSNFKDRIDKFLKDVKENPDEYKKLGLTRLPFFDIPQTYKFLNERLALRRNSDLPIDKLLKDINIRLGSIFCIPDHSASPNCSEQIAGEREDKLKEKLLGTLTEISEIIGQLIDKLNKEKLKKAQQ